VHLDMLLNQGRRNELTEDSPAPALVQLSEEPTVDPFGEKASQQPVKVAPEIPQAARRLWRVKRQVSRSIAAFTIILSLTVANPMSQSAVREFNPRALQASSLRTSSISTDCTCTETARILPRLQQQNNVQL
jgi:hypothetical protein